MGRLARRFTESSVVRVVGAMHGTASLMNPSESPASASGSHVAGGPGPLFGAGGPLGIRVQAERPSVACILRAVERRTR